MSKRAAKIISLPKGIITTVQFAELAGVRPTTVTSWAARGKIPFHPAQESPRGWRAAEVKAWIRAGFPAAAVA